MQAKFYLLAGTILIFVDPGVISTPASRRELERHTNSIRQPLIERLAVRDETIGTLETRISELMATLARTQAALARAEAAGHHAEEEKRRDAALIAAQERLIEELRATAPRPVPAADKEEVW